jgi:hypothetical protein
MSAWTSVTKSSPTGRAPTGCRGTSAYWLAISNTLLGILKGAWSEHTNHALANDSRALHGLAVHTAVPHLYFFFRSPFHPERSQDFSAEEIDGAADRSLSPARFCIDAFDSAGTPPREAGEPRRQIIQLCRGRARRCQAHQPEGPPHTARGRGLSWQSRG